MVQVLGASSRVVSVQPAEEGMSLPSQRSLVGGGSYGTVIWSPNSLVEKDKHTRVEISKDKHKRTIVAGNVVIPTSVDFEYCGESMMNVMKTFISDEKYVNQLLMAAFLTNQLLITAGVKHNDFTPQNICVSINNEETLMWQGHKMTFPFRMRAIDFGFAGTIYNNCDPVQINLKPRDEIIISDDLTDTLKENMDKYSASSWFVAAYPNMKKLLYMDFLQLLTYLERFLLKGKYHNKKISTTVRRLICLTRRFASIDFVFQRESVGDILGVDLDSKKEPTQNLDVKIMAFETLEKEKFFPPQNLKKRKRAD